MVRHDITSRCGCGGSQLRLQSKRRLLPLCASRLLPARLLWVWLCSVRARAARAEVRDTRVCVSLLLGTVAAEADCRCLGVVAACFSVWRFLSGLMLTSPEEGGSGIQRHIYNTQSGLSPREVPFCSIDLGEVALRPCPT